MQGKQNVVPCLLRDFVFLARERIYCHDKRIQKWERKCVFMWQDRYSEIWNWMLSWHFSKSILCVLLRACGCLRVLSHRFEHFCIFWCTFAHFGTCLQAFAQFCTYLQGFAVRNCVGWKFLLFRLSRKSTLMKFRPPKI